MSMYTYIHKYICVCAMPSWQCNRYACRNAWKTKNIESKLHFWLGFGCKEVQQGGTTGSQGAATRRGNKGGPQGGATRTERYRNRNCNRN